ncbi:MAG: hypothetical protein H6741_22230 [Alphaproteobacteria bacterium]|nr:hypothetical protein [Alphaproteobacteria bacterium]
MSQTASLPPLPEDASWPRRLYVGVAALTAAGRNPGDPEAGRVINLAFDRETYERLVPEIQETEAGQRLLSERPSLQAADLDLAAFQELPEGTVGRAIADYYVANGITPFETNQPGVEDTDYLSKRYRETHDLLHLLTGYGTDVLGEMELQAFVAGNLGLRQGMFIASFGYLGAFAYDGTVLTPWRYIRAVRDAYRRGKRARFVLTVPFEDYFEAPVQALQAELFVDEGRAAA